jgi:hypothetical protein
MEQGRIRPEAREDGNAEQNEWFRVDAILKEEVMRSLVVWFVSFLVIGGLAMKGYVYIPGFWPFVLAMIPAALHASLMTRYRRREHIYDPSITTVVGHMMESRSARDEMRTAPTRNAARKAADILTVVIFALIYISASAFFPALRPLWIVVLVATTIILGYILFDGRAAGATPLRTAILYAVLLPLLLVHAYSLGHPVIPVLEIVLVIGGISCSAILIWRMVNK